MECKPLKNCQIFLGKTYKQLGELPNLHKIFQMAIKYKKNTQIVIFWYGKTPSGNPIDGDDP
jgi:hypothetical protein